MKQNILKPIIFKICILNPMGSQYFFFIIENLIKKTQKAGKHFENGHIELILEFQISQKIYHRKFLPAK